MTRTRAPWILAEAAASGASRSWWLACTPPVGLALLVVLYAWISGMTVLGDALLILIKGAAVLLAVAWAASGLRGWFGRGLRPRAVVAAPAIFGLGAAGVVWMFPGVWTIPSMPLALPTLGIAGTIPAMYIVAPALACAGGYIAYRRFTRFRRSAVTERRERIAADGPAASPGCASLRPPCSSARATPPGCRSHRPNRSNCGSPSPSRLARMTTRRPPWQRRRWPK